MQNFRTYQLAVQLYQQCKEASLPAFLKDQLMRASSSIALNLAEGSAKPTQKDRARFYAIALGSLREVQALIGLESHRLEALSPLADQLGAHLYKLHRSLT